MFGVGGHIKETVGKKKKEYMGRSKGQETWDKIRQNEGVRCNSTGKRESCRFLTTQ